MRLRSAVVLLACALAQAACTSPPEKEMNQARGAIQAARAAGADQYASDEYNAALTSLKRSEDAVEQRDYRQALNFALDSREQAQNAARTAANEKAAAGSQAEREMHDLQVLLDQAYAGLKAAEGSRAKRGRAVSAERRAVESAATAVQKARTAMGRQDYLGAREAVRGVGDQLRAAIRQIEGATSAPGAKRRR
jgi:hypothetical protein